MVAGRCCESFGWSRQSSSPLSPITASHNIRFMRRQAIMGVREVLRIWFSFHCIRRRRCCLCAGARRMASLMILSRHSSNAWGSDLARADQPSKSCGEVSGLFPMVISGSCRASSRQLLLFRCVKSISQLLEARSMGSENVLQFHLSAMSYPRRNLWISMWIEQQEEGGGNNPFPCLRLIATFSASNKSM
jgi:hypothetical protein